MGIRDDASQFVQGIVQIVHTASFAGVDVQSDGFTLAVLGEFYATGAGRR